MKSKIGPARRAPGRPKKSVLSRLSVGLSNILDSELNGRKPVERPHGKVVGTAVMDSKLLFEVCKRIETAAGIETFLVFPVAALYLAIVSRGVRPDELMTDAKLLRGRLEQGRQIPFAVRKTVGKFETIIRLDALHPDAPARIPLHQLFQEISGRIGGLFLVCSQETQTGKLVNSSVLKQTQLRVRDTASRNNFHIHLDPLAGIGHLLIGLWRIGFLWLFTGKQSQLPHDPEQTFRTAVIAPLPQMVP